MMIIVWARLGCLLGRVAIGNYSSPFYVTERRADNGNKDTLIKIETHYSWKMGPLVQGTKRIMVKLVMEGSNMFVLAPPKPIACHDNSYLERK